MTVCLPSSRQRVYALANLQPCTRPKATVRGSCKGRVSQLNHFDAQIQAFVCCREINKWHIRVCSWCELEFITNAKYKELVTREDCVAAVNRHTAKLLSNKGIMDLRLVKIGWTQGRNEVRWRPGQEISLASLCSNLRSFRSNAPYWKKYLWHYWDFFSSTGVISRPPQWFAARGFVHPLPPVVTPLDGHNLKSW